MAVVRARSAPPYALIIFVFLWVVSSALAVFFYMQADKAEKAKVEAEATYKTVANSSDKTFIADLLAGQPKGTTALGVANRRIGDLRRVIDGNAATFEELTAPQSGIAAKTVAAVGKPDADLLSTIRALDAELKAKAKQVATLEQLVKAEQEQYKAAKETYSSGVTAANRTSDERLNDLNKAAADVTAANASKTQQTTTYEKEITTVKEEAEQSRRKSVLEIEQLKGELAKRDNRIDQLQTQLKNLRPDLKNNVAREPDGSIVRVVSGTNEVYINLGKNDRVLPLLTFSVHDPKLGVRSDTDGTARGKGGIEVLEVGEKESLCRITHTEKGQRISAGDLIFNPVFSTDKTRKFHFVVFGDFDLDGDTQFSSNERERIVRLIQSWGGIIDDTLTTQTDFLVIGNRPAAPAIQADASEEEGSVAKAQLGKQKSYDDLVAEAKRSSIPVLNQNRFLAMIGYYNTTIVKH